MKIFTVFSWGLNNLTNYGRRHFKLFTNCHVSFVSNEFKIYLVMHCMPCNRCLRMETKLQILDKKYICQYNEDDLSINVLIVNKLSSNYTFTNN